MTTRRASPTVKIRRVAGTLRELRERAGLNVAEAASAVDHDPSWLSRIERAETRAHPNDVQALLLVYDQEQPVVDAVVAVARQARQRGWWYRYNDVLPEWFTAYLGLESDASFIRTYEPQTVPGLLQTEDYARATIVANAAPGTESEIAKQVALRTERKALLTSDDPPQTRIVLDESVLWRTVGGPHVMRVQIERLVEATELAHIQVQILPFRRGAHAGMNGAFVILDFPPIPDPYPDAAEDKVVYVDTLIGALYLEKPNETATYTAAFEQIRAEALSLEESRDALRTMAKTLAS